MTCEVVRFGLLHALIVLSSSVALVAQQAAQVACASSGALLDAGGDISECGRGRGSFHIIQWRSSRPTTSFTRMLWRLGRYQWFDSGEAGLSSAAAAPNGPANADKQKCVGPPPCCGWWSTTGRRTLLWALRSRLHRRRCRRRMIITMRRFKSCGTPGDGRSLPNGLIA